MRRLRALVTVVAVVLGLVVPFDAPSRTRPQPCDGGRYLRRRERRARPGRRGARRRPGRRHDRDPERLSRGASGTRGASRVCILRTLAGIVGGRGRRALETGHSLQAADAGCGTRPEGRRDAQAAAPRDRRPRAARAALTSLRRDTISPRRRPSRRPRPARRRPASPARARRPRHHDDHVVDRAAGDRAGSAADRVLVERAAR
jgi:hypothetical protein